MNLFSLESYVEMLIRFKEAGYTFAKFHDVSSDSLNTPIIISRHDIDFSCREAVGVAGVERDYSVQSTFFFHLRSPLYNVLSSEASRILTSIHEWGHDIALHIDLSPYGDELQHDLYRELRTFESYYPFANTRIVSFHRPGAFAHQLQNLRLPGGIRHTYEREYFQDMSYFSDSRGAWQRGDPTSSDAFHMRRPMQILTHPLWWSVDGEDAVGKLDGYLKDVRKQTIQYLEQTAVSFSLQHLS